MKSNKKGVTPLQLSKKNQIYEILKDIPDLLPRLEIRYENGSIFFAFVWL